MTVGSKPITMWEMSNGYTQQPHWWEVGYPFKHSGTIWQPEDSTLAAMRAWCSEITGEDDNIFGAWSNMRNTFCFRDRNTFLMFKIRWLNHVHGS